MVLLQLVTHLTRRKYLVNIYKHPIFIKLEEEIEIIQFESNKIAATFKYNV